MAHDALRLLIERWREDAGATYQTWFLWEERLKNFRSIRRGLAEVVTEIQVGTFGTAYQGSSLETVVGSIAERGRCSKVRTTLGSGNRVADLHVRFLPYSEIARHRDAMARFGHGMKAVTAIARTLV